MHIKNLGICISLCLYNEIIFHSISNLLPYTLISLFFCILSVYPKKSISKQIHRALIKIINYTIIQYIQFITKL